MAELSKDNQWKNAIKTIEGMNDIDEITAFTEGETRKSVVKAKEQRIAELSEVPETEEPENPTAEAEPTAEELTLDDEDTEKMVRVRIIEREFRQNCHDFYATDVIEIEKKDLELYRGKVEVVDPDTPLTVVYDKLGKPLRTLNDGDIPEREGMK